MKDEKVIIKTLEIVIIAERKILQEFIEKRMWNGAAVKEAYISGLSVALNIVKYSK